MENIIETMFFSPTNVTVIEFLANYFINILGFAFPIFILVALVLLGYQWATSGFHTHEFRKMAISMLMGITLISIILYTPGRKTIEYRDKGVSPKSYLIVDTINDIFNVGSRLADGFVYHMLFGSTYTGSNEKILQFKPDGGMFQLIKNGNQPTSNDVVDGFFVNALNQMLIKKINKNNIFKKDFEKSIQNNLDNGQKKYKNSINLLKTFTHSYLYSGYYPLKIIFNQPISYNKITNYYNNISKSNDNNLVVNAEKYYLDLNNYKEFLKFKPDDKFEYNVRSIENNSIKKIVISFNNVNKTSFANYQFVKKDLSYDIDEIKNSNGDLLNDNISLLSKKTLQKVLNDVFIKNQHIQKDYLNIEKGLLNVYGINIKNHAYYKEANYKSIMNNLSLSSKNVNNEFNQVLQLYPELNKNYYNVNDIKKIIDNIKNLIIMKIDRRWHLINSEFFVNGVIEQNQINKMPLNEYMLNLSKYFVLNKSTNVNLSNIHQKIMSDYVNLNLSNFVNGFLQNSINSLYFTNNGLDPQLNSRKGIKLGYLDNTFLFNTTLQKKDMLFNVFDHLLKKQDIPKDKTFHWYDLPNYAVGLKNLFVQQSSVYAFAAGFKSNSDSQFFISKCLPVFYEQNRDPTFQISEDLIDECMPKNKFNITSNAGSLANTIAMVQSISTLIKDSLKSNSEKGVGSKVLNKFANKFALVKTVKLLFEAVKIGAIYYFWFNLIFFIILFFYYVISIVFFSIAVLSWLFKASFALMTFGFSVVLFIFNHKRKQLEAATLNVIMYSLMPIYISLMFLLIIYTSFVMSETIDTVMPNISGDYTKQYRMVKYDKEVKTALTNHKVLLYEDYLKGKKNNTIQDKDKKTYNWENVKEWTIHYWDDIFSKGKNIQTLFVVMIDQLTMLLKIIILLILDVVLYLNLWRVDRYLNEIIGTNISDVKFNVEKIIGNFSRGKL